jgi:hypothetical protein
MKNVKHLCCSVEVLRLLQFKEQRIKEMKGEG